MVTQSAEFMFMINQKPDSFGRCKWHLPKK
jgi:hypothetical protein